MLEGVSTVGPRVGLGCGAWGAETNFKGPFLTWRTAPSVSTRQAYRDSEMAQVTCDRLKEEGSLQAAGRLRHCLGGGVGGEGRVQEETAGSSHTPC